MHAKLITEEDLDLSSHGDFFAVVYSVFDLLQSTTSSVCTPRKPLLNTQG